MIEKFKKLVSNRVVQNASWIMIGRIVQMFVALIVGVISARYLGPANYGLINYGMAYVAFFSALCTLGINSVLVKEFIENPGEEGAILGTSIGLKFLSSVLSVIMIVGVVSAVDKGEQETILIVFACSISIIFQVFETINYWFQSKLESKVVAIVALIGYSVTALYKIVLLILGKSVVWFALSNAFDYICVGVLLIICYKRANGKKFTFSITIAKRLWGQGKYYLLPAMMVSIYGYTDKFMLKQMMNEAEVGFYSTAVTICGMWCFILTAIIDSFYPIIVEAHSKDREEFKNKNVILYTIVLYISVFVSIVICVAAPLIVLILYGDGYIQAVGPLRIVTWYTAFSYLGVARDIWIVCEKKQKYLIYIYPSAAVINVLLNLFLIPTYGGEGAAIASVITQVSTIFVIPLFIKELRPSVYLMKQAVLLKGFFHRVNK